MINSKTLQRVLVSFCGGHVAASALLTALLSVLLALGQVLQPERQSGQATVFTFLTFVTLVALCFSVPTTLLKAFDAGNTATMLLVGGLLDIILSGSFIGRDDTGTLGFYLIALAMLFLPLIGIVGLTIYGSELVLRKYDAREQR
jgi:hypothetical protein